MLKGDHLWDLKMYLKVMVWEYWLCYWAKTESSEQANMNFQVPWKLGNFLPSWERLSYLRWTLLRDVGCVSISLVFIKANSFWTHCKAIHGSWHFRCGHVKLTSQPERCCVAELKDCDGSLWWLHVNITPSWAKYPPFRPNKILDKKPVDFWMSGANPMCLARIVDLLCLLESNCTLSRIISNCYISILTSTSGIQGMNSEPTFRSPRYKF
jgi:hypothetical protein